MAINAALGAADDVIVLFNGAPYAGWLEVNIEQSFDKATGQGTVKISEQPGNPFPVKIGATAQILLAGTPVITGHVHEVNGEHDDNSHTIQLTIRDKTQDAIDSTVGPGIEYKPPIALKDVMQKTLGKMGLGGIKVIDKVNPDKFGNAEVPVAEIDDTGFGFFDRWATKRNVVLNTDGKGNLVIDRNQKRLGPGMLYKSFEDSALNNVKKSSYKNSDFGRSNKSMAATQKSPNDMKWWESRPKGDQPAQANPLSTKWGSATDSEVRPERKKHFRGSKGLEGGSPKKTAKWRSNVARGRGFQYVAVVQGFEMSPGQIWWPGFVIPVRDDQFEVSDELLIVNVRFSKKWGEGATTQVTCTHSDAYTEDEGGSKSRTAKRGSGTPDVGTYDTGPESYE